VEGAASLTLKAAQWSGAGGVALHPNKPFLTLSDLVPKLLLFVFPVPDVAQILGFRHFINPQIAK
jgi:hypothetical protein